MTVKSHTLTDAQTAIIRIEDLIAKKDTEHSEGPAGTQGPVMTRTSGFGNFTTYG